MRKTGFALERFRTSRPGHPARYRPNRSRVPVVLMHIAILFLLFASGSARADQWVLFFYHIHTQYSLDNRGAEPVKNTVKGVLAQAENLACSLNMPAAVAITDHNNINAVSDPAFRPSKRVQPIKGEEWGGKTGHAGALGYFGTSPIAKRTSSKKPAAYKELVSLTHRENGIVIVNHPMGSVPWHSKRRLGVDAIEIWNGMTWKKSDAAALAWWNRLLVSGERIAAVGGSDSHFRFQSIAYPMNLVYAASNQPKDVLAAVKAGRVVVLSDPSATRVFLRADRDGKTEHYDAMGGDLLPAGKDRTVRFKVLVTHPRPSRQLALLDKQGVFYTGDIGSGAGWKGNTYRFERSFRATERNFVRAEIRRKKGMLRWNRLESLCNPIYWVGVKAESPSKKKNNAGGYSEHDYRYRIGLIAPASLGTLP